ncbi:DUF2817 domain-containing protein [Christiangramia portivictoriae]|uniref:DUF2817 domain-containing protein n=1 Tax=Christiangramia portivictoriae TaxID=326069 RepID=UPI000687D846|nr:DUF2817 domain-containing protein [Christiangramia portivictoriae]
MRKERKIWLSNQEYDRIKYRRVSGRYLHNDQLEDFISKHSSQLNFQTIGTSVEQKNIYGLQIGNGKKRVLIWSQMHGNESTTTKAVLDFLHSVAMEGNSSDDSSVLDHLTLYIIPILNPDGAAYYTRVNANGIDLNRDMQDLSQPESRVLMDIYREFKPDYCLNLHDQRTIFSAGQSSRPAILSFLTPSSDSNRTITDARKKSMALIAGMVQDLEDELGDGIGRYDDGFNINCAGDTFQALQTPTILFEAGHYPGDYRRDVTRKYVYKALRSCLFHIAAESSHYHQDYFKIPENAKLLRDIILKNVDIGGVQKNVLIQFKEILDIMEIRFVPVIEKITQNANFYGHHEIDAEGRKIELLNGAPISENVIVNKIILNDEIIELNPQ